eukprot:GILI01007093.1.p1 GENE.GILI01007093.1~~GILI01007093.1.p1  ORF type:complete len:101 (-),score=22.14 GILI01007093.1:181-483(-)
MATDGVTDIKKLMQKPIIKYTDMNAEMTTEASEVIISALDKYMSNIETAARAVKDSMDKKFGQYWHCIIGEGYSFEVTAQQKSLLFLYYGGNIAVLLYKC